jgi:hypothetical protein
MKALIVVIKPTQFCRFSQFSDSPGMMAGMADRRQRGPSAGAGPAQHSRRPGAEGSGRAFAAGEPHGHQVAAPDADLAEQGTGLPAQRGPLRGNFLRGEVEVQALRVLQLCRNDCEGRAPAEASRLQAGLQHVP